MMRSPVRFGDGLANVRRPGLALTCLGDLAPPLWVAGLEDAEGAHRIASFLKGDSPGERSCSIRLFPPPRLHAILDETNLAVDRRLGAFPCSGDLFDATDPNMSASSSGPVRDRMTPIVVWFLYLTAAGRAALDANSI
jgi:hypothetical protein